jgi:hypothetical protein
MEGRISGSFTGAWPTPSREVEEGEHGDGCRRDLNDCLTCAVGEKWRWGKTEVRVQINAQPRDLASILVEGCGRWSTGEVEF